MKRAPHIALVTAGPADRTLPARFPELQAAIGPVKAQSLRLASRAVNALRAGKPARDWADLADCDIFLVSAPEQKALPLLREMAEELAGLAGKVVLLDCPGCKTEQAVEERLRAAATAIISEVPPSSQRLYLVEGDTKAVRAAQRLLQGGGARIYTIRRGTTPLFGASLSIVSLLIPPLLEAAAASLTHAGLSAKQVRRVLEQTLDQTLRGYWKGGRRSFKEPRHPEQQQQLLGQLAALESADPETASYVRQSLRLGLEHLDRDTGWLEPPPAAAAAGNPSS